MLYKSLILSVCCLAIGSANLINIFEFCHQNHGRVTCKGINFPDADIVGLDHDDDAVHPDARTLEIYDSDLQTAPKYTFKVFPYLNWLIIQRSNLKYFHQWNLENKHGNLTNLVLSENHIETIPSSAFEKMKTLEQIDMGSNAISTIHEDSFGGLDHLTHLKLYDNHIEVLPAGVFDGLVALKELDLSHNQIEELNPAIFAHNAHLENINLNFNKLKHFDSHAIAHLHINALRLGGNQLEFLEIESANLLSAPNNHLETIHINGHVRNLHIFNNKITDMRINDLSKLYSAKLGNNQLTDIRRVMNSPNMNFLDISHNPIHHLDQGSFLSMPELRYLNMSSTHLHDFDVKVLAPATGMIWMDIEGLDLSKEKCQEIRELVYIQRMRC